MSKRVNNKSGRSTQRSKEYGHPCKVRSAPKGERYESLRQMAIRRRLEQQRKSAGVWPVSEGGY